MVEQRIAESGFVVVPTEEGSQQEDLAYVRELEHLCGATLKDGGADCCNNRDTSPSARADVWDFFVGDWKVHPGGVHVENLEFCCDFKNFSHFQKILALF